MKAILAACAFFLTLAFPAHAREGYADNGRPLICAPQEYVGDPEGLARCVAWISGVKQPHSASTCCGEGDAYIADQWEPGEDGGWVAIITTDYPAIGGLPAVPAGTRIPIPREKIDDEHQGNPTGHGVVFFNWIDEAPNVLCYFTKNLT